VATKQKQPVTTTSQQLNGEERSKARKKKKNVWKRTNVCIERKS